MHYGGAFLKSDFFLPKYDKWFIIKIRELIHLLSPSPSIQQDEGGDELHHSHHPQPDNKKDRQKSVAITRDLEMYLMPLLTGLMLTGKKCRDIMENITAQLEATTKYRPDSNQMETPYILGMDKIIINHSTPSDQIEVDSFICQFTVL